MSTRRAKKDGPMRQERYASSDTLSKGLLGNLVAKRCSTIADPAFRKLIYFLQDVSIRGNAPLHPTCNLFAAWPWVSSCAQPETPFQRVTRELIEMSPARLTARSSPKILIKTLPALLERICLDPGISPEQVNALTRSFRGLLEALLQYQSHFTTAWNGKVANTSTRRDIVELLDYALCQRGMVLAEGTYRTGKSFAAQAWCQQHLGEARYVQLSSGTAFTSFFRDLAKSVGVGCSTQKKASEMRVRIEDALLTQHLLLVIDEGDYIWPATTRLSAGPERVNWIMTALVNRGVPVALIGSKNFSRLLQSCERRCPVWGAEQFYGRLRLRKPLPEQLSKDDLWAIAELTMPEADEATVMLLVGHALRSKGYVAAIETAVSRARFFAAQEGRNAVFTDVERVVDETAGDSRTVRSSPAKPSRAVQSPQSPVSSDADELAPALPGGRDALSLSSVPVWTGMFVGARSPG